MANPIVLFDGDCNFCDSSVQFILKRDKEEKFYFTALQSKAGEELQEKHNVSSDIDSMVLIDGDKVYYKSGAALRIARHLKGLWKLSYIFIIVPPPIRNAVYNIIANNRYKWFGKKEESCALPSPEVRKRFL
ncbi:MULTISPECIES: thiol-disulfide oxidoreductase DCC family protein [Evansella]|jgi:predicted DCC family thiol-disulfide oxidoreductase YuxK|uniref:thiol-disulfide oxidoreductase DCC family protein n=1 Tax=Evansella TaxID=2837485 RepID=UPI000996F14D|nr:MULTISPECIES: thiol-disulfide oxidoreductase DCC family protein [Evansella]UTR08626.1 thiol-disulfide oxidoreductase DCC family protein [Evansella sp. LMS18]